MQTDPNAIAKKWNQNLANSVGAIKAGVQAVQTAPGQQAAAQAQAYASGVQQAVASGKFQRNVAAVSLGDWQQSVINKGIPRIATGAAAAVPKVQNFMSQFIPHLQAGQAKLASMPRGTIDQNIQRMIANVQHNAQFKLQK